MTPALFDTNIIIDYLSGIQAAYNELTLYSDRAISIITWIEVMVGAKPDRAAQTRAVLNMFVLLPLTAEVAERAVGERRQSRMKLPDAIILATAHVTGRLLITPKHEGLLPESPARPHPVPNLIEPPRPRPLNSRPQLVKMSSPNCTARSIYRALPPLHSRYDLHSVCPGGCIWNLPAITPSFSSYISRNRGPGVPASDRNTALVGVGVVTS